MSDAAVLRFQKLCAACERGLHDRCWWHLDQLFGWDQTPECPCGCWDEDSLTHAALLDMMKRQPEALARKVRFDAGFDARSSLRFHLRP